MKYWALLVALAVAALSLLYQLPFNANASAVLAITLFTAVLWFTEALPLHITALFAAFLLIAFGGQSAQNVFSPFFDPVVALLFGGFILALALQKHGLDERIAISFLSRLGCSPFKFLLGVMLVTAFLSMWISNTASTAMMLPIALAVVSKLKDKRRFGALVALAVAYSANVGGLGTIVGTPPNAIAIKYLADYGVGVSFLGWMQHSLPFVAIFIPLMAAALFLFFRPNVQKIEFGHRLGRWTREQKGVLAVISLTVLLWVTTQLHGVHASAIAMLPPILLFASGLLEGRDFEKARWDILILIGGGLSLGAAVISVGLDAFVAEQLSAVMLGHSFFVVVLMVVVSSILLTVIASNTATAALFVPVIISLASVLGFDLKTLVMSGAMGTSLDFMVPVGTPPNAIAYSSGYVSMKEMAGAGIVVAALGAVVLSVMAVFLW
ncbi:MAG: DASS family sodium-coupled anion symporter [Candidatus Diapherotrites archaeon]|nr:DASS family sodium-coupled anion symporter [Candidatus Diapherotrites archaeon]